MLRTGWRKPFRPAYYNGEMTIAKMHNSAVGESAPHGTETLIGRGIGSVLDLVFPPRCLVCQDPIVSGDRPQCPACVEAIDAERSVIYCPGCACTVVDGEVLGGRCSQCRNKTLRVDGTVRVAAYGGYLAQLVRAYKYNRREALEPILGGWLAQAVESAPWRDRVEAILPVPTYWLRRAGRALYPAERLAAVVAKETGLVHAPLLRRVHGGPHQIGLSKLARIENVRGAFALRADVTLNKARLLLIDDVKTTGATIDECAKVLRHSGAAEVYAAVVVKVSWEPGSRNPIPSI